MEALNPNPNLTVLRIRIRCSFLFWSLHLSFKWFGWRRAKSVYFDHFLNQPFCGGTWVCCPIEYLALLPSRWGEDLLYDRRRPFEAKQVWIGAYCTLIPKFDLCLLSFQHSFNRELSRLVCFLGNR